MQWQLYVRVTILGQPIGQQQSVWYIMQQFSVEFSIKSQLSLCNCDAKNQDILNAIGQNFVAWHPLSHWPHALV